MAIGLQSDFKDFYDHVFAGLIEGEDKVWTRNTRMGMKRSEMLAFLQHECGFNVPANGIARVLVPTMVEQVKEQLGLSNDDLVMADLSDIDKESGKNEQTRMMERVAREAQRTMFEQFARVVVHTDEMAHRGEGKLLLSGTDALRDYPDTFCTQYIPTRPDGGAFSQRLLVVGDLNFIIEYASEDWRSNVGEVQTAVRNRFDGQRPTYPISSPIYAIDFVANGTDIRAIDLNVAPGLDLIKPYVTAEEIYAQVEKYL